MVSDRSMLCSYIWLIFSLSLVLGSTWKAYFHQEGKIHLVTLIFIECPYCQLTCGMNSETCDGYAFFCRTPWGLLLNRAWHMKRWASRHSLRIMLSYPRSSEFLVFYIIAINKIWRNMHPYTTEVDDLRLVSDSWTALWRITIT